MGTNTKSTWFCVLNVSHVSISRSEVKNDTAYTPVTQFQLFLKLEYSLIHLPALCGSKSVVGNSTASQRGGEDSGITLFTGADDPPFTHRFTQILLFPSLWGLS